MRIKKLFITSIALGVLCLSGVGASNEPMHLEKRMSENNLTQRYNFFDFSGEQATLGWSTYINENVTGTTTVDAEGIVFDITTGSGTDWHVKLERVFHLVKDNDYLVKVAFAGQGSDQKVIMQGEEKTILSTGITTHTTTYSGNDADKNIEFQFGTNTAGTIKINYISIEKIPVSSTTEEMVPESFGFNNEYTSQVNFFADTAGTLNATKEDLTATITTGGNLWEIRMVVETHIALVKDQSYTLSIDALASQDYSSYEVNIGTGWDDEKSLGALYGQTIIKDTTKTHTIDLKPTTDVGNMFIFFKVGQLDVAQTTTFKLSNLSVLKNVISYPENTVDTFTSILANDLPCDSTGLAAVDLHQWNFVQTKFELLSSADKATLKSYVVGTEAGTNIDRAIEKYDYIMSKYGDSYNNFIGRTIMPSMNNNFIGSLSNDYSVILVTSALVITCVGMYIFANKSKLVRR